MAEIDKNPRQITRLRVEDQKKLEELATELTYNSTTNTVEVGKNLSVNGTILTNYNNEAFVIVDENNSSLTFSFEQGNALVIKNENATGIYFDDFDETGEFYKGATSKNLKTVFGKSIMKDPEQPEDNNIDLYKHYLHIQGGASGAGLYDFYIVIQSSSNVDCSSTAGATKKLRTLLKVSPATPRMYETGVCGPVKSPEETENYSAERSCALYWDGSLLYVRNALGDFEMTLIEDRVETL